MRDDGPSKSTILSFVDAVTTAGPSYVPPAQRIATFDIDGTLWCEKPMYVQADFIFRRLHEMVVEDPSKAGEQPWKAVVENDRVWLGSLLQHIPELVEAVSQSYA